MHQLATSFTNPFASPFQCCAVEFVKSITHDKIGLTKEEYETQMRDGVSVTLCPVEIPDALSENERRYDAISQKYVPLVNLTQHSVTNFHIPHDLFSFSFYCLVLCEKWFFAVCTLLWPRQARESPIRCAERFETVLVPRFYMCDCQFVPTCYCCADTGLPTSPVFCVSSGISISKCAFFRLGPHTPSLKACLSPLPLFYLLLRADSQYSYTEMQNRPICIFPKPNWLEIDFASCTGWVSPPYQRQRKLAWAKQLTHLPCSVVHVFSYRTRT